MHQLHGARRPSSQLISQQTRQPKSQLPPQRRHRPPASAAAQGHAPDPTRALQLRNRVGPEWSRRLSRQGRLIQDLAVAALVRRPRRFSNFCSWTAPKLSETAHPLRRRNRERARSISPAPQPAPATPHPRDAADATPPSARLQVGRLRKTARRLSMALSGRPTSSPEHQQARDERARAPEPLPLPLPTKRPRLSSWSTMRIAVHRIGLFRCLAAPRRDSEASRGRSFIARVKDAKGQLRLPKMSS